MILYEPLNAHEPDKRLVADLAARLSIPAAAARILINRGFRGEAQITAFLNPGLEQLPEPEILPDMAEAVGVLSAALDYGERIFLFGDYDVDGVCAVSILYEHIKKHGGKVEYRVPNRSEGYGLSVAAVEDIAQKADLLITLDCGITTLAEIARARELGLKTIVTDHHQCLSELPQGPVVNPHRPDSEYPFRQLCGTGVALKLIQALSGTEELEAYLDRAALATVADIVPLTGENRVIVAEGLKRIERGEACVGLKAMLERCGVLPKGIKASNLAFALAPRINAAGRIGDAMRAIELLTTSDAKRAKKLAEELDEENKARQGIEQRIMAEALDMLKAVDLVEDRAIMLSSPEWHQGVTGIVASRLTERFYKPVLLFHEENDMLTASCRSIPSVHLFDALSRFSEMFVRFGGHAQAAGLTIEKSRYNEFKRGFLAHMRAYPNEYFLPKASYDAEMRIRDVNAKFVQALEKLAPFGFGNSAPVLRVKGTVNAARTMGADNSHLRFTLVDGAQIPAVGFSMGSRLSEFAAAKELDALLCPEMDTYRGDNTVRSVLRHARPDMSAAPDALIARNEQVFFESFLNDALLCEGSAEIGIIPDAYARAEYDGMPSPTPDADTRMEELLTSDIQGSLIIARTPKGAVRALERLGALGLRERVELCFGSAQKNNENAYHTLLLAPDMTKFEPMRFKNVLVYDSCLTDGYAAKLLTECGAGVQSAQEGDCIELLEGVVSEREALGECYRALRQIASGAYEYASFDALFTAARKHIQSPNPRQLMFALRVFDELGFLSFVRGQGQAIKVLAGKETKKQLLESSVYRFIRSCKNPSSRL